MCNLSQEIKEDGIATGESGIITSMLNNGYAPAQIAASTDKDIKDMETVIRNNEQVTV